MDFWRISNHPDLLGAGAEFSDGRWHTAGEGKRLVYLAEHPAVALIENLVNLSGIPAFFPDFFNLLKIVGAGRVPVQELTGRQVSSIDPDGIKATQAIGDAWLAARGSALLRVPSIPSPESWNYLLNPLHPDAAEMRVEWARPITYDRRLFHLADA